jgi:hypothetical protein
VPEEIDDFTAWAEQEGWGDGLLLVPPTQEKVAAYIEAAGLDPHVEIGELPPRNGLATVETLAVNAVMADAAPEALPILIAAVRALLEPDMNLQGMQCTTNPVGPMMIVNGAVADRASLSSAGNALAGGNRGNLTLGRALQLVLRNIGGSVPPIDQSVIGSPLKRGLVLAENEAESPWDPLGARRGVAGDAVTVLNVESLINVPAPYREPDAIIHMMAHAMCTGLNLHYSTGVLMACFNPEHAQILADAGMSADDVREELFQRARVPVSAYPRGMNASQSEWVEENGMVLMTDTVGKVQVMVAGFPWPAHSLCISGWAISGIETRAVDSGSAG